MTALPESMRDSPPGPRSGRPPPRRSPARRRGPIRSARAHRPRRRPRPRRRACAPRSRRARGRATRVARAGAPCSRSRTRAPLPRRGRWPRHARASRSRTPCPPLRPPAARSAGADTTPTWTTPPRLERDQRRPDRDAARVVPGAVDRVDDPAARAGAGGALLLAEDRIVGALVGEQPSELGLDGAIGLGHRGEVGLRLDGEAGAEARQRDRVGRIGESQREIEVGAHGADTSAG